MILTNWCQLYLVVQQDLASTELATQAIHRDQPIHVRLYLLLTEINFCLIRRVVFPKTKGKPFKSFSNSTNTHSKRSSLWWANNKSSIHISVDYMKVTFGRLRRGNRDGKKRIIARKWQSDLLKENPIKIYHHCGHLNHSNVEWNIQV